MRVSLLLRQRMANTLVPLPEIERLSPACIRILGGNPGKFTLQGTNTYLLGTGPRRLLVDTGEGKPSWIAALRRTLEAESASISDALLTHWHHDHVGGVADLLALSPATRVHKHAGGPPVGIPPGSELESITDGQRFEVDGAALKAVHTPGHTADHIVLLLEQEDAMFTADNVLGHGTAVFEDLGIYLASLSRMRTLFAGRAYPGHGPVLPDGPAKVREYIAHRAEREEQVLQSLSTALAAASDPAASPASSGPPAQEGGTGNRTGTGTGEAAGVIGARAAAQTPMDLVRVIYSDVSRDLWPAAERGVVQILRKLEADGRVGLVDGDRWTMRGKDRPQSL